MVSAKGTGPMGLCWSTFFWGILSLIGIISNGALLGFTVPLLSLELIAAFGFVYALQCMCVGGCWIYAWTYPIVIPTAIIISVFLFMSVLSALKRENDKKLFQNNA